MQHGDFESVFNFYYCVRKYSAYNFFGKLFALFREIQFIAMFRIVYTVKKAFLF